MKIHAKVWCQIAAFLAVTAALMLVLLYLQKNVWDREKFQEAVDAVLFELEPQIMVRLINDAEPYLEAETYKKYAASLKEDGSSQNVRRIMRNVYGLFGQGLLDAAAKAGPPDSREFEVALAKLEEPHAHLREMVRLQSKLLQLRELYPSHPWENLEVLRQEMHLLFKKGGIKIE